VPYPFPTAFPYPVPSAGGVVGAPKPGGATKRKPASKHKASKKRSKKHGGKKRSHRTKPTPSRGKHRSSGHRVG